MRRAVVLALAVATALAAGASGWAQTPAAGAGKAQEQQVLPPEARYWMGATTGGGMLAMAGMAGGGKPSVGSMMRLATSGMPYRGAQHPAEAWQHARRQG